MSAPESVQDSNEETDLATQKLNELRARARKDFSTDEVENFIKMGKVLASKSILSMLICLIKEGPAKGLDEAESKKLTKKIEQLMPYNYSGYVSLSFKEIPYILNVCLSLVDKDYVTDIDIPHESYAKDLYGKYDFLKQIARAFWRQFAQERPELIKRIAEYRTDIDFSDLVTDPVNTTVMYFDQDTNKRVGIFCYYVDEQGRPFYKKRQTK